LVSEPSGIFWSGSTTYLAFFGVSAGSTTFRSQRLIVQPRVLFLVSTHFEDFVFTASIAKSLDVVLAVASLIEAGGADYFFVKSFSVVCSGHTSFLGVVHVGSGIQTSVRGITDGVFKALNLGVSPASSTGSDVHELI